MVGRDILNEFGVIKMEDEMYVLFGTGWYILVGDGEVEASRSLLRYSKCLFFHKTYHMYLDSLNIHSLMHLGPQD